MKIKETRTKQAERLKGICEEKGVNYESIEKLLISVKVKRLLKRNNFHQQTISDIIEKAIK